MAQLLLELLSEEIPARMQNAAAASLSKLLCEQLDNSSLGFDSVNEYSTPRRLAVVVNGLPEMQPNKRREIRGPKTDAPEKAINGFLKANCLSIENCEKRGLSKGEYWFGIVEENGRRTKTVLSETLPGVILSVPWKKSMRWGCGSLRWVRPLREILCLLDGEVVPFNLGDGIVSGQTTRGHRFYAPEKITVGFFDDYEKSLQRAKVILNPSTRRKLILDKGTEISSRVGLKLRNDDALLTEVVGLVEWPVPLLGAIDSRFMKLPEEVLITTMRAHQKYFALEKDDGSLAAFFMLVANIDTEDKGVEIIAGNERVLRARLTDAEFFWDQDRKKKLEDFIPELSDMVFHEKLGTLLDKTKRLQGLATFIATDTDTPLDEIERAAFLCKGDLLTGVVCEFASLQGIMGRYYAIESGESPAVADAIAEHYAPIGPDDNCPDAPISIYLSVADKIDHLVGFFGIDEKPSGSRDPYALRRAALGVIRVILKSRLRLPLAKVIETALEQYRGVGFTICTKQFEDQSKCRKLSYKGAKEGLLTFLFERLKVFLRSKGKSHDLIDAVLKLENEDDIVRIVDRLNALEKFLSTQSGESLLAVYRRTNNILEIAKKKEHRLFNGDVNELLLVETSEKNLFNALRVSSEPIQTALDNEDFTAAMELMADLRSAVDIFFDQVKVNVEDNNTRQNRFELLGQLRGVLEKVAFLRCIEG